MDKFHEDGISFVDLETDYYWIILSNEWDNFGSDSPEIAVCSLVDDWDSRRKVLAGENIATYGDLDRTSSILRAVSEAIAPSK